MKKIIALFVVMLAFGLNANAQQKTPVKQATTTTAPSSLDVAVKQAAAKDVAAMMETIALDDANKQNFMGLFEYKHRLLMQQELSAERKSILAETIEAKIKATLTPAQNEKMAQSPALLQKLTH